MRKKNDCLSNEISSQFEICFLRLVKRFGNDSAFLLAMDLIYTFKGLNVGDIWPQEREICFVHEKDTLGACMEVITFLLLLIHSNWIHGKSYQLLF